MKSKIIVILIVGFTIAAGVSSYYGRANLAEELNAKTVYAPDEVAVTSIKVGAEPITLNPEDDTQIKVGDLTFVTGWVLSSDSESFGGWSGLLVKNSSLLAINDQGNWLQADLNLNDSSVMTNSKVSLFDPTVGDADKKDFDAESVVALADGYLVGFEQDHRIMKLSKLGAVAERYDTGVDLSGLSHNSGIEAMTILNDGSLLMFAESGRDTKGRTPAWLVAPDSSRSVDFFPPENYEATDAATLPNGDVLLLMRYYSVLTGASAQIRLITSAEVESGVIRGKQIAELKQPLNVDNMEGLDLQILDDGTVRLFIISDDNFSRRQRTLFMVFDWPQS